jgi:hypothetical protein
MNTYIFIWKIKRYSIARAILHMALDRRTLKLNPNISFFKLLGTGTGERFTPRDADTKTWALLVRSNQELESLSAGAPIKQWRKFAVNEEIYNLAPLSSHGEWGGLEPFTPLFENKWDGEIAAITRAKIRWHHNLKFWRAVPSVTQSLHRADGLVRAIGIGEAPIGLQGTFSHWQSQADLRTFAYKGEAHKEAIRLTSEIQWYSEELFARFAILSHKSAPTKAE